jgi:hypothetical protein
MKIKLSMSILVLISFISCDSGPKIKEIYYRDLTPFYSYSTSGIDTIKYWTEILFLYEDGSGIQFKDQRGIEDIDKIVVEKLNESKILQDHELIGHHYLKIQKYQIDDQNFMIRIIAPGTSDLSFLYKCYFEPANRRLKTRYYMIDKKDTLWLTKTLDDPGIYTFEIIEKNSEFPDLKYPQKDVSSKNIIDVPNGR